MDFVPPEGTPLMTQGLPLGPRAERTMPISTAPPGTPPAALGTLGAVPDQAIELCATEEGLMLAMSLSETRPLRGMCVNPTSDFKTCRVS